MHLFLRSERIAEPDAPNACAERCHLLQNPLSQRSPTYVHSEVRSTGIMLGPGNHEALAIDCQPKRSAVSERGCLRRAEHRGRPLPLPPRRELFRGKVRRSPGVAAVPRKNKQLLATAPCSFYICSNAVLQESAVRPVPSKPFRPSPLRARRSRQLPIRGSVLQPRNAFPCPGSGITMTTLSSGSAHKRRVHAPAPKASLERKVLTPRSSGRRTAPGRPARSDVGVRTPVAFRIVVDHGLAVVSGVEKNPAASSASGLNALAGNEVPPPRSARSDISLARREQLFYICSYGVWSERASHDRVRSEGRWGPGFFGKRAARRFFSGGRLT